MCTSLFLYKL